MSNIKISVCMATYNGEKYIRTQIDSILTQLRNSDELIISDDTSSDNTIGIIKSIQDRRIKLLPNQTYRSPIFNFENALKHASGDVIFLADQDDIWHMGKVKIVTEALSKFDLVVSDCTVIDEKGKTLYESFYDINRSGHGFLKNLIHNSYLGCCMAFRKEVLEYSLPFPQKLPMHDWWLGLVGQLYFKTHFLQEKLVLYRRHGQNASPTSGKSENTIITKLSHRFRILWELLRLS